MSVEVARIVDEDGDVKADAAIFDGGPIVVKWRRHYFDEGDRTDHIVTSQYATVEDAEQGTSGTLEVRE